jgi:hypothetical protein
MRLVSGSVLQPGSRLSRIVGLCALAFVAIPAQGALALPVGMHYEMVSPVDPGGMEISTRAVAPDGSAVALYPIGGQGFGGTKSMSPYSNSFVSVRTPNGWVNHSLNPDAAQGLAFTGTLDFSTDIRSSLAESATYAQSQATQLQLNLMGVDGSVRPTFPVLTDLTGSEADAIDNNYIIVAYTGSSQDLSHSVIQTLTARRLLPTDSPVDAIAVGGASPTPAARIYEVVGVGTASATLRRVDVYDDDGTDMGPACAASSQRPSNLVSADGSKIFFEGRPDARTAMPGICTEAMSPRHVMARVDGERTVDVSAAECAGCPEPMFDATYISASLDGRRVVFMTRSRLVAGDGDSTNDLYLYDFAAAEGSRLTQISHGDASDATPGAGALVTDGIVVSDDGSRTYFVASDVLTTQPNSFGQTATPGANNVYVHDVTTSQTRFIATVTVLAGLTQGNVQQRADLSNAAGDYFVFNTATAVAPSDTDATQDVYRYSAATDTLIKVSPGNANSDAIVSGGGRQSTAARRAPQISAEGTQVVYWTEEALDADDDNAAGDVYLWNDGVTELVSDGHHPFGAEGVAFGVAAVGDQVFFATPARLATEDVDDVKSVYVARTGAGFPVPPDDRPHCEADECQGDAAPPVFGFTPTSSVFSGAGNLVGGRVAITGVRGLSKGALSALSARGSAVLRVRVNGAGRVSANGRAAIGGRVRGVLSGAKVAKRAGTVAVRLRLSAAGRSALRRGRALSVPVTIRMGDARPKVVTVRLRAKAGRKGGRS